MSSMGTRQASVVPYDPLSYLHANATERGDAPAVIDGPDELSFAGLLDAVHALMSALSDRGIGAGDVVGVALPNVWRYVALEIAVPATGAVLLPLPMSLGRLDVESALERAGARLVVTDGSEAGRRIAEAARAVGCVREVADAATLDTHAPAGGVAGHPADPDRIVQIALTSGTTGRSKLASLSARLKQLTFEGFTDRLALGPSDRVLPLSPITQGAGEMTLYALRTGAALVMRGGGRFDAEQALALAQRSRATVVGAVPTMVSRMLHSPALERTDLGTVRALISAGAPLPPSAAQAWEERTGSRSCSFYGAMDIGQVSVPRPSDPAEKRWVTVGRPHDRAEVLICGPEGAPMPPGRHGEICMRGPLVQQRYWGERQGPFGPDGWAHTGDLGFIDDQGFLHVTGRVKDTIIRGGNNINPFEVEDLLRGWQPVHDACVVGHPDADLGERAAAFVVPSRGAAPTLDGMVGYLETTGLARFKWPESLHVLEALPVGSTGKVDRRSLRSRLEEDG
jgi:acyl-CoA synthetase (AMP-forming)/AMP-acid ligase II